MIYQCIVGSGQWVVGGNNYPSLTTHYPLPTISIAFRQTENSFGHDVAQDFAGPRFDGVSARSQIIEDPASAVEAPQLRVRSECLHRGLLEALIEFAPLKLEDRALGAWGAGLADPGER